MIFLTKFVIICKIVTNGIKIVSKKLQKVCYLEDQEYKLKYPGDGAGHYPIRNISFKGSPINQYRNIKEGLDLETHEGITDILTCFKTFNCDYKIFVFYKLK